MIAYTGIETISNMAEEARDETQHVPRAIKAVVLAVFAIYAALPMVALSALPVHQAAPTAATRRCSARARRKAASPATRCSGSSSTCTSARCSRPARSTSACSPRRSCSSPPTPASSAPRGWSTRWACTARCPTASAACIRASRTPWIGILLFGGVACLTIIPGQGRIPRQHVRVRGDAVVHDRAPVGDPPARQGARPAAPLPRARARSASPGASCRCSRCSASSAPASRSSSSRSCTSTSPLAGVVWLALGMVVYVVYRRQQGLDLRTTTQGAAPRAPAGLRGVRLPHRARADLRRATSARARSARAAKLIGEDGVVYAVFVLPVPSQLSLDAGLEEEEAQGRSVLESARIQARRAGHQDPHRADPHAQPRRGARRGGRTRRRRRHLLVDDPRARRRAADRPDRRLPARKRPCRVIIETENRDDRARGERERRRRCRPEGDHRWERWAPARSRRRAAARRAPVAGARRAGRARDASPSRRCSSTRSSTSRPVQSLGVVYLLRGASSCRCSGGSPSASRRRVLSAAAFNFFHLPPVGRFTLADERDWVGARGVRRRRGRRRARRRARARARARGRRSAAARPTSPRELAQLLLGAERLAGRAARRPPQRLAAGARRAVGRDRAR